MRVTLLGTGDTTGTPTPGCECETCHTAADRGVERTRFSVHVENENTGESLLVDTSPDVRYQLLRDQVALPDAIVITHIHFDHLDGLGNAYRLFESLPVYAANETDPTTGESVAETIDRKYDYLDRVTVSPQPPLEPFETCGFTVTLLPVEHPPFLCYGVTIEDETGAKLSITGDTNFNIPDATRDQLADPDLLLADAIVPARLCDHHPLGGRHETDAGVPRTIGTKHMTMEGALSLAEELNAERTRLVHVSHFPTPEEAFGDHAAVDGERYQL
ncbi:MBL fold metallo-hydrolase [Halocatena pleomorpha]|uniref:MBL fold metallo-hydrolase n=1 Tax=Halocatena pleomorpha TaxID=1785090 RepID=A0A3P3RBY6_9EURY|nr:MBL fold metallo-hydrolase [Halocatena pleomorpha]RRJ30976.1 MBL fold metallo-hydrolase [Halocatena pleomorpha]